MPEKIYRNWISFSERKKAMMFWFLFSAIFTGLFLCTYFLFFRNGKSFIWNYDGIKQHYSALIYLGRYYREIIKSVVNGSFQLPQFDFSIGMGEDIITSLNFYGLGDPLTLLAAFVPAQKMEYLYNFLVVFRMYFAGLSFAVFCRYKKRTYSATLIGALIYAFSGYVLHVAVKHPFFVIPMIFLPLSVIAVERAIEKKRLTLLMVMVFFTALNGFYFFYMNTIFLVIYAVAKVVIHILCERKRGREMARFTAGALIRCIGGYLVGVAMAAILFVPSILAFGNSARSESAFHPGNLFLFDLDKYNAIFTRMIGSPGITWDYLGMASIVLLAVVGLFLTKQKNRILKVNLIIWTLLMLVPFGGYMLNGFSYVSGRFMYLVTFVYALAVVYALPELLRMRKRQLVTCCVTTFVYLVAVLCCSNVTAFYRWFGFIMLVVTLLLLAVISRQRLSRALGIGLLFLVVSANIVGNGWLLFGNMGQGYVEEFIDAGKAYKIVTSTPESAAPSCGDNEFYRVDSSKKSTENACMVTGDYGVSSYLSISNPNRIQYLLDVENAGVLDSMFKISGLDGRLMLQSIGAVKYVVLPASERQISPQYKEVKRVKRAGKDYVLYENTCYMPFGVTFDSYSGMESYKNLDGLQRQEMMTKTVFLQERPEQVQEMQMTSEIDYAELPYRITEMKNVQIQGDEIQVNKAGGSLTLEFDKLEEGELYLRLGAFELAQKERTSCDVTIRFEDEKKEISVLTNQWNWYFGREEHLVKLGTVSGEKMTCRIRFQHRGTLKQSELKILNQNITNLSADVTKRMENILQKVSFGENQIAGEISVDESKLLFLSIPYSNGWRAKVDDVDTKIYQADTAYMAIEMSPGTHQVLLEYTTPGLQFGMILSILGFVLFAGYVLWGKRAGRGKDGTRE